MTQLKLFKMDTNDLRDQQQKKALNHWAINGHRSTRMWIWGIITLNGGLIPFRKQFTPWI